MCVRVCVSARACVCVAFPRKERAICRLRIGDSIAAAAFLLFVKAPLLAGDAYLAAFPLALSLSLSFLMRCLHAL